MKNESQELWVPDRPPLTAEEMREMAKILRDGGNNEAADFFEDEADKIISIDKGLDI
jgi:hypothetical protein